MKAKIIEVHGAGKNEKNISYEVIMRDDGTYDPTSADRYIVSNKGILVGVCQTIGQAHGIVGTGAHDIYQTIITRGV